MGAASLVMMMVVMTLLTSHVAGAVSESSADTLGSPNRAPSFMEGGRVQVKWGTHPECDSACASVRSQKRGDWDWDRMGIGGWERDESTDLCLLIPRAVEIR